MDNSSNLNRPKRNFTGKRLTNFREFIKQLDRFGRPIKINVSGFTEIKSLPGAILSIICYVFLLLYFVQRTNVLF